MKKIIATSVALAFSVLTLAACGAKVDSSASAVASEESKIEETENASQIYRGTVISYTDKEMTVEQLDGYDYGQSSIIFNLDDKTEIFDDGITIAEGAYVEVTYNGALTRSLPAQGTAESVTVISAFSDGIIQNGIIQNVSAEGDSYIISIVPIDTADLTGDESSQAVVESGTEEDLLLNETVLIVPKDALENITEEDLVNGFMVSAVTNGIATASLPPQMPVVALLPYSEIV